MSDPMAEIKASFFIECEELLESLQDALSDLDEGADDGETINVVFRAVHSIKGGAGAFGAVKSNIARYDKSRARRGVPEPSVVPRACHRTERSRVPRVWRTHAF